MLCKSTPNFVCVLLLFACSFAALDKIEAQTAIPTYHYDNYRTGWNQTETALTPANVNSKTFGMLQTVALDGQVDAQPLVVPGVMITAGANQGLHDVVYVVTENNTVYAIDAESGVVLLNPNFGTPVAPPPLCGKAPKIGIHSTPTIDLTSNTMYLLTYTKGTSGPGYMIHALDLGSLTDKVAAQAVAASHMLTDGTTLTFNALYQRQRPALLLANGNVYAAFGSFCDNQANLSRGWVLGWSANTLAPMPTNELIDTRATAPGNYFLSSIWMSGYGPAADDLGNVLFVTGNSQNTTYDGVTNIQESVIKMSTDLSTVLDLFTPFDEDSLDDGDFDFGSGGVMVLPDQPGTRPHMAVAAGKDGHMFLLNEDHLGGYSPTKNNVLGTYSVNPCWCGESYFVDPVDGASRVVSSGGRSILVWKLHTSPKPGLSLATKSASIGGGQLPGFFTTVSSNGKSNVIIWAVSRPQSMANPAVNLFVFNPDSGGTAMKLLYRSSAGTWPNPGNNANIVPVVANGRVYVASSGQLQIFGLKTAKTRHTQH